MSGLQTELGPNGFQAVESAINENPDVPGFIRRFGPTFPVGVSDNMKVLDFMQLSSVTRNFVPFMVLIDREGVIRFQHTGSETEYFSDDFVKQSMNIRTEAAQLMNEPRKAVHRKKTRAK